MIVERLLPSPGPIEVDELLTELALAAPLRPFCDEVMEFCAQLSGRLLRDPRTKGQPALVALAFWMRGAELLRLRREFDELRGGRVLAPRGLVFHVPPANVDTMFVYSWLLSLLTGNLNVMRISMRDSDAGAATRGVIADLLARPEHAAIAARTAMIRYDRDDATTARICAQSDVRVLWGGDETVRSLRAFPLPLHARDLAFPDRFSLALLDARRYLKVEGAEAARLAEQFFNDAYWFDQLACSSPRLVVWRGAPEEAARAGKRFYEALAGEVEGRAYSLEPATALGKFAFAHRAALDEPVSEHDSHGNAVSVLTLSGLDDYRRSHHGAGTFLNAAVGDLAQLERFVTRRDQTVTHWGLDEDELTELVRTLNGRGVDRWVPIGRALQFGRFWDGYDLLAEFTRNVHVEFGEPV
ncbi:MAG: acyl-CoA reductase [Actinomycetota bacterium]